MVDIASGQWDTVRLLTDVQAQEVSAVVLEALEQALQRHLPGLTDVEGVFHMAVLLESMAEAAAMYVEALEASDG